MQKVWYYETSVNYNCAKPLDILPNVFPLILVIAPSNHVFSGNMYPPTG